MSSLAGHKTAHEPVFALPDRLSSRDWTHGHRRQWCGLPSPAHEIGLAEAAQGRSVIAPTCSAFIGLELALALPAL